MIKKLIILSLLPLTLFSYELNFNKKFSIKINPDILRTYISITVQNKDEQYINDKIEIFNDYLKENDEIIKQNGNYILMPKYKYLNNNQKFIGYIGTLNYTIISSKAVVINEFINQVMELKDKINSNNIKIHISNLSLKISDKHYNDSLDNLRYMAINWIDSYIKKQNQGCTIKSISIDNSHYKNRSMSLMSRSASNIAPIQTQKNITINPNYKLECR